MKEHHYSIEMEWTGNTGQGTKGYTGYSRNFEISATGKQQAIPGSSDPSFRGDPSRYNPEDILVSSISSCHMLWFLHLCASKGITVLEYRDKATGMMVEAKDGSGAFKEVILFPEVVIDGDSDLQLAEKLHTEANKKCFIANSCNFPIRHQPRTTVKSN